MRAALDQAALTADAADVPIGAVVLSPAGEVIGSGHNVRERDGDPTGHAEVVSLDTGHFLFTERPGQVAALITEWVNRS